VVLPDEEANHAPIYRPLRMSSNQRTCLYQ
jgi:hypothetical protein